MNEAIPNSQEHIVTIEQSTSESEAKRSQLQQQVERAISDPGSVVPREKVPHLDDEAESIPHWGARAVMVVIAEIVEQRDSAVALLQQAAGMERWPSDEDFEAELARDLDGAERAKVGELQRLRAGLVSVLATIDHLPCLDVSCVGAGPSVDRERQCSTCSAQTKLRTLLDTTTLDEAETDVAVRYWLYPRIEGPSFYRETDGRLEVWDPLFVGEPGWRETTSRVTEGDLWQRIGVNDLPATARTVGGAA